MGPAEHEPRHPAEETDPAAVTELDNWASWSHASIREMLDTSVNPETAADLAETCSSLGQELVGELESFAAELHTAIANGWEGQAAESASAAPEPVVDWGARLGGALSDLGERLRYSASIVEQAQAAVPPPAQLDYRELLNAGIETGSVDVVAEQDRHNQARAQAVAVMTTVYNAGLAEAGSSLPAFPHPTDPTQPESAQPESTQPESTQPESAQPGSAQPTSTPTASPPPSAVETGTVPGDWQESSYMVGMGDIFDEGRHVAPPVIGETHDDEPGRT